MVSTSRWRLASALAVLGPNGAGKTTLVLHLNRGAGAERGRVSVDGLDTADKAALREIRRRVGLVFQDPDDQLFCPTVRQDVAFRPANLGLEPDEGRRPGGGGPRRVGAWARPWTAPHTT